RRHTRSDRDWSSDVCSSDLIAAAGFLGMFVCGGPVYLAGTTTSAINLALIMALSPLMVLLLSLITGLESVNRWQVVGMIIALSRSEERRVGKGCRCRWWRAR